MSFSNFSALLLCAFLAGGTQGCEHRASSQARLEKSSEALAPSQQSWNVSFKIREGSHPRVHIEAGHLAKYEQEDSTYTLMRPHPDSLSQRVRVDLFDAEGDSSATIRADQVFHYEEERRYKAQGNVVVKTSEGKRLESEELYWNEAARMVSAPGFVRITTPDERIQGYELTGDEQLENYTLARVTGQVTLED